MRRPERGIATRKWIASGWAGVTMVAPAHSAVAASGEMGFVIENSVEIATEAGEVYPLLTTPGRGWNGEHSFSGDAANLRLEAKAGSVEHARVILSIPDKQLRLFGALGAIAGRGDHGHAHL